jgi:regulatory protein
VLANDDDSGDPETPATTGLDRALATAYRFVNRRERTEAEMRMHLSRAGVTPANVEQAVATLVEQGYLDDARFVRLFVQDKRELDGWGNDRIRPALLARGISADLADDALSATDSGGELDRALGILRARFPTLSGERRERERALGMLLRKGYEVELALDAIAAHAAS